MGQQIVLSAATFPSTTPTSIRHCDVQGGADGIWISPSIVKGPVIGPLLDLDPLFVDPSAGDYRLGPESPCVDAGDPDLVPAPGRGDLGLEPRLAGGRVDIGADEVWRGLVLGLPAPGLAGLPNTVGVTGAPPGALVALFHGTTPGTLSLSSAPCPDLALGIADAALLTGTFADAAGEARLHFSLPSLAGGGTLLLQAVAAYPGLGCKPSNAVAFPLP